MLCRSCNPASRSSPARGRDFGLMPYGVLAMQSLRVEKALPLYGNDVNEDYTPFHVGLDRWIIAPLFPFIAADLKLTEGDAGRLAGRHIISSAPAKHI